MHRIDGHPRWSTTAFDHRGRTIVINAVSFRPKWAKIFILAMRPKRNAYQNFSVWISDRFGQNPWFHLKIMDFDWNGQDPIFFIVFFKIKKKKEKEKKWARVSHSVIRVPNRGGGIIQSKPLAFAYASLPSPPSRPSPLSQSAHPKLH